MSGDGAVYAFGCEQDCAADAGDVGVRVGVYVFAHGLNVGDGDKAIHGRDGEWVYLLTHEVCFMLIWKKLQENLQIVFSCGKLVLNKFT